MSKVITGISALYKQGFISYSPSVVHVEMPIGTNTTGYSGYKISLQSPKSINIGTIKIDDKEYYGPERLFIELNKFNLENTIKEEAIKKLEEVISPDLVKNYYDSLKNLRRGLDTEMIINFLNKNLLLIKDAIKKTEDKKMVIREYVMALVSKKRIPVCLIKGGSAVELFTNINRTTLDIDAHADIKSIEEILSFLEMKNKSIYFKLKTNGDSLKNRKNLSNLEATKKVFKFVLLPVSKGGVMKKELENVEIPISFNISYSNEELQKIIDNYKLSKRKLKHLPNACSMIFSREMLLAEKFQSLINKPENSTRTKDLIDLKLLWEDKVNFNSFRKWLFRKWSCGRFPKNEEESKEIIKENSSKDLLKIKENFEDAVSMYDIDIQYQECLSIYKKLIIEASK